MAKTPHRFIWTAFGQVACEMKIPHTGHLLDTAVPPSRRESKQRNYWGIKLERRLKRLGDVTQQHVGEFLGQRH